jgi:hypothetical protein
VAQHLPDELQDMGIRGDKECRNINIHGVAGHRAYTSINANTDTQTSQYFSYRVTEYPNGYSLKVVTFSRNVNILRDIFQLNGWPVST